MSTVPSDQKALLWNAPPVPGTKPRPGEFLWLLRKSPHTLEAQLRYHGEYGVEIQILRDDEFFYGRRYDLRESAVAEGEALREHYRVEGWCVA